MSWPAWSRPVLGPVAPSASGLGPPAGLSLCGQAAPASPALELRPLAQACKRLPQGCCAGRAFGRRTRRPTPSAQRPVHPTRPWVRPRRGLVRSAECTSVIPRGGSALRCRRAGRAVLAVGCRARRSARSARKPAPPPRPRVHSARWRVHAARSRLRSARRRVRSTAKAAAVLHEGDYGPTRSRGCAPRGGECAPRGGGCPLREGGVRSRTAVRAPARGWPRSTRRWPRSARG